jgi:two-component system, response regulator PdtaR
MIPAYLGGRPGVDAAPVRVLLAEDEFLLRMDAADHLRRIGWEVIEVSSADEAMELLRYGVKFDLLLTDIDMPGQANGLDLARHVRTHHRGMKIAIMTGETREDLDLRICDLFLKKPVWNVADVLRALMKGEQHADGSR